MSNFGSASGLLGTVVIAGTSLIALKLVTDFVGGSIKQTQKSLPKSNYYYPKPFKSYRKFNDYGYGYSNKRAKKQDIFSIKF